MRGKSINLFLMDGTPSGRIKCTLANWTGVAYKIPRTELDKCKGRDDLAQSGVYFLFGTDEDSGDIVVYVGQSGIRKNGEGILYRLQEHKRNAEKDYWTEAIVFTTSNNSFGPTEISWLENRFCAMATEAKRYTVKNGNDPNVGNVTEEKESELEEFVDYAKIVMGTLGHKVFEPLRVNALPKESATDAQADTKVILELKQGITDAKGMLTSDGFVLLKGSKIKMETAASCPKSAKNLRESYAVKVDDKGILQEDILLKSPNVAAGFVTGISINARDAWKTSDGITLKKMENSGAENV